MTNKPDNSATEDFFGLPHGSLVEAKTETYFYIKETKLPELPKFKAIPRFGVNDDECDVCGCWPCVHTDPDDFDLE